MGIVFYDVAAVLVGFLNLFLFYSRSRLFITQTRIFVILLYISLFTTLLDIISVATIVHVHDIPLWLLYGVNVLYFIFQNSIAPLAFLFLLSLGWRFTHRKFLRILLLYGPWSVAIALILSTPLTGWVFYFNEFMEYSRGDGLTVLYILNTVYAVLIIISLLTERRQIQKKTKISISLFLPFSIVPLIVQYFFPALLIQNLGIALSELIIIMTIQDFGRYVYQRTGLFNRNGFVAQLKLIVRKRIPFTAFLVVIDNVEFLRHALGPDTYMTLEKEMTDTLFTPLYAHRFTAQIGDGKYVLVITKKGTVDEESKQLLSYFKKPWTNSEHRISFITWICKIRFPDDTTDIQQIFQASLDLSRKRKNVEETTLLSFTDLPHTDVQHRFTIVRAIQQALVSGGFDLYFQPIIHGPTGAIVSAEALIRLYDNTVGWIPPGEFIPIAEQTGTMYRIGNFVIERACSFLARLRTAGFKLPYLEVNLSTLQCIQANFTERMLSIVRRFGLEPADICFEITETATTLSQELMKQNLKEISAAGFAIAIDDFGTGNSNIGTLLDIPFRFIKIDRSMFLEIEHSDKSRLVIESLITMFRDPETEIIAEGIENLEQIAILQGLGLHLIQGYYYSKPLPAEEFLHFIQDRNILCI